MEIEIECPKCKHIHEIDIYDYLDQSDILNDIGDRM